VDEASRVKAEGFVMHDIFWSREEINYLSTVVDLVV
jgi:hypothetical protein